MQTNVELIGRPAAVRAEETPPANPAARPLRAGNRLARRLPTRTHGMRLGIPASGLFHALAIAALLIAFVHRPRLLPLPEGQFQVVFGDGTPGKGSGASGGGRTNSPKPAPRPAPSRPAAAVPPPPAPPRQTQPAESPVPPPAPAPAPAKSAKASAAPAGGQGQAENFAPVRLNGDPGGFDRDLNPDLPAALDGAGNLPPDYPNAAVRRGEQGQVVLGIHVGDDGLVQRIDIVQSSGYADLDESARRAALAWHYIPQFRDGLPSDSYREQVFRFELNGPRRHDTH